MLSVARSAALKLRSAVVGAARNLLGKYSRRARRAACAPLTSGEASRPQVAAAAALQVALSRLCAVDTRSRCCVLRGGRAGIKRRLPVRVAQAHLTVHAPPFPFCAYHLIN